MDRGMSYEAGIMTPLDGQQRLTTLFLLHWYAAKKENISDEEAAFLRNFGYETRYSARNFCRCLTGFIPSFTIPLSEEIIDQAWFPLEWKKDPTISAMLVMIEAIQSVFSGVEDLWGKLKNGAVTFYFLPIRDMGLTDELYIKMNSRGKPLTRFEHFKAELERSVRAVDEDTARRIIRKVDLDWTDMLWRYRDSGTGSPDDVVTDDEFLKYFHFICDILCYEAGESPQGKSADEFDLLQNSEDEVSDRLDRNRIPAILQQTEAIIKTGQADETVENNYNVNQLAEEKEKREYIALHPEQSDLIYELEDHPNLKGQISVVGLDHLDYAGRFASLFTCDWDKIDCALMATGDYGQQERNRWRYQYGSKSIQLAWDELFHKSANSGFENTREVLLSLLSRAEIFTDEILQEIADAFMASCEETGIYPWRYYYVKYDVFRPGSYGKYGNGKRAEKPYLQTVMQTRSQISSNSYMPFLKEADEVHLSKDSCGQRLVYGDVHIACANDAYLLRDNETEEVLETLPIRQNEEGQDTEDQIVLLKDYITRRFS